MYCKACNTRLGPGDRVCPNCGVAAGGSPRATPTGQDPSASGSSLSGPLSPSSVPRDLDHLEGKPARAEMGSANKKSTGAEMKSTAIGAAQEGRTTPGAKAVGLGPAQLRSLLAERPELLGDGMGLLTDKQGAAIGVAHKSDVGVIDLIARDDGGGLVVVLIADRQKGSEIVESILQRMGWVRKHLGKPGQEVRGVVLAETLPDDLGYTAAAIADTVQFKKWRLSVSFDEVEL